MITIPDSLAEQLSREFAQACAELAHARHRQRLKDTTAYRAAVAEWQTTVDQVLDMYLETAVDRFSRRQSTVRARCKDSAADVGMVPL